MTRLKERLTTLRQQTELTEDIRAELEFDPAVGNASGADVSVDGAIATLEGVVESLAQKWAVERAVRRVDGVQSVLNDLVVVPPKELAHDDDEIATAVGTVLAWTAGVPGGITVLVVDGTVSLDGTVGYRYQRQAAEDAVRRLVGVKAVDNGIDVATVEAAEELRETIAAAIRRRLGHDQIHVEFDDGVVTLNGTVHSWLERSSAEDAARLTPGVREVADQILVDP